MLISVIIINYNTFELTCNCIRSVMAHTREVPYEIVVVDNASPTDNADLFLEEFPNIKLVKSPENGGFAKGNNLGIAQASGDILLLLNSDTVLTADSIGTAARCAGANKNSGAVSVKLVYEDGAYQHNARKFRSIRNELLDLLRPLLRLIPYKKRARLMLNQYFRGDMDLACDWVSGAFLMFRREVLEALPGKKLDERFFMYGEDQLWCYQMRQAGYTNLFVADNPVIHIANASTEPEKQLKLLKHLISRELDIMKYRKGESFYYFLFKQIFVAKEMARYYIKIIVHQISGRRIR